MRFNNDLPRYSHSMDIQVAGILAVMLVLSAGCSQRPASPTAPTIDPAAAAARAVMIYDDNKDGTLDKDELTSCPALSSITQDIDQDSDGAISKDEIQRRLASLVSTNTILVDAMTEITLGNRPLAGATITLEPEPFLGEAFTSLTAVTDSAGMAGFSGHDPKLPGVYLGLYKIRVSKDRDGKETIPDRYNIATELGIEVAAGQSNLASFSLENK